MASIYDVIRDAVQQYGSDQDAAEAVYDSVTKRDLMVLLIEECAHERRHLVRRIEMEAARPSGGNPKDMLAERERWLSQRFALGDGQFVTWGEATVEDHHARIQFLSKLRDGIDQTIRRHEVAVTTIRESGVSCLNEIDGDNLAGVAA